MIVTIGDLVEDVVVTTTDRFRLAADTPARISRRRGGSAANVAVAIARCGGRARFVGTTGADDIGDRILTQLTAAGVAPAVQRRGRTGTIVVVVTPDGERSFLTDRADSSALDHVDPAWLDDATALHAPSYCFAEDPLATTARTLIGLAHERGLTVTIDTSSTTLITALGPRHYLDLLAELAPDALFANHDEATLLGLGPGRPAPGATTSILRTGDESIHVVAADGSTTTVAAPRDVAVTDSTGAGDAFAAGWLLARLDGADPVEATAAAHVVAARMLADPEHTTRPEER